MTNNPDNRFVRFEQLTHPLAQHKLTKMRKHYDHSSSRTFSNLLREVGILLAVKATETLGLGEEEITTFSGNRIRGQTLPKENLPVIVPILRSGLIMADGVKEVIPTTYTGHIGIHRNQGEEPTVYMAAFPDVKNGRKFFVIDPVTATGKTACLAVGMLRDAGIPYENIIFLTVILTEQAKQLLTMRHSGISEKDQMQVYYVAKDAFDAAKDDAFPGIGSVSERIFRSR